MSRRFAKPNKCKQTGKTMFKKESDASYAMMRTWAHDSSMNIYDYHTYSCPHCSHWHFGNQKYKPTEIEITDTVSEIPEVFDLKPKVVATGRIVFDDPPSA